MPRAGAYLAQSASDAWHRNASCKLPAMYGDSSCRRLCKQGLPTLRKKLQQKKMVKLLLFHKPSNLVHTIISGRNTKVRHPHLSSVPVCWYLCFVLVRNFCAAILRLHFSRQTGLNPGWSVMHLIVIVPSGRSWRTSSLLMASLHPSNSLQQ